MTTPAKPVKPSTAKPTVNSLAVALRRSLLHSTRQLLELESSIRHGLPERSLETLRLKVLLVDLAVDALHPTAVVPPTLAALNPEALVQEKIQLLIDGIERAKSPPSPSSRPGKRG